MYGSQSVWNGDNSNHLIERSGNIKSYMSHGIYSTSVNNKTISTEMKERRKENEKNAQ
jgi:hypothetical protein